MIYTASMKTPLVYQPGQIPGKPWVSPEVYAAQENAGLAGKINHAALEASRGSLGIKV